MFNFQKLLSNELSIIYNLKKTLAYIYQFCYINFYLNPNFSNYLNLYVIMNEPF